MLYPNIVCFTPESSDSTNTTIDFLLGLGQYADVSYDCEGRATNIDKYSFIDYGASVSHNFDELKLGMRVGGYSLNGEGTDNTYFYPDESYYTSGNSAYYINPFIGFDHKYIEINMGLLFLSEYPYRHDRINDYLINDGTTQFSGLIRIGNQRAFHFSSQYLSNVPIFSGGGLFDMGVGFGNKKSRTLTWVGLSAGPFQNAGLGIKQNVQVSKHFDILIKGRIGQIESNLEASISAGARYNF
jgi:hypothetical protein